MLRRAIRRFIARVFDYAEACSLEQTDVEAAGFPSHAAPVTYVAPLLGPVPRVTVFQQGDSVARN